MMIDTTGLYPQFIINSSGAIFSFITNQISDFIFIIDSIDPNSPPPPKTGYKPPKNSDKAKKRVKAPGAMGETGWLDKKGRVWVPSLPMHGRKTGQPQGGWRRHYPDGSHDHVYPDGSVRSHDISNWFEDNWEYVVGGAIIVVGSIAVVVLVADNATVVGVADDPAIPAVIAFIGKGLQMVFG